MTENKVHAKADKFLDCKGLNCPLPIVNIGRALKQLSVGQTLAVEADDPAFKEDVIAFVNQLKHKIISLEEGNITRVIIQKEQ